MVGDRCAGLVSTVNSMLPDARYQRCTVHFMRNVLSKVSHKHAAWAASALKAVFAMESRQAALEKAEQVATEMESKGRRPPPPVSGKASARPRPTCSTTIPSSIGGGSARTT